MNELSLPAVSDDDILPTGLTAAEDRTVREYLATRAAQSKRERLLLAASWAIAHGSPVAMDSKGWPLDAVDWPLRPRPDAMPETQGDYGVALRMAKGRRTRRLNLAALAEVEGFRLSSIKLAGVPAFGSTEAMAERGRRWQPQAAETPILW